MLVLEGLAFLGVRIDPDANQQESPHIRPIHTPDSTVEVWVVPTDEGRVAAAEAWRLIGG